MEYKVIFTCGDSDDIESLTRGVRGDILISDEFGNYYNPKFITLERIKIEFKEDDNCYLEDKLVIMHKITKETILNSISQLHKWLFFKRWIPLTIKQLEEFFYPTETWVSFPISV